MGLLMSGGAKAQLTARIQEREHLLSSWANLVVMGWKDMVGGGEEGGGDGSRRENMLRNWENFVETGEVDIM